MDLPEGERTRWLQEATGGDEALVRKVRGMLARERGATDAEDAVSDVLERRLGERLGPGDPIGPYELIRPLGSGGMGAVWLARRRDLDMEVAVKVIKRGMDTDEILQRFQIEQRVMAGLNHPGIARLIDAGVAASGSPYLVMEYVEGVSLAEAAKGLDLRGRLGLFREVCAAVSHAHRSLVVHRDLKPANILVTAGGAPKLLDFGIAKLLGENPDAPALGFTTLTGHGPLTPRYASPEQIRGEPVSTATDVFALGTILYELLSGCHPIGDAKLTGQAFAQAVCEGDTQRPSARACESEPPVSWAKDLKGDLDTITLVALHKEPARRFGSVEQLSEDVRRYLGGFPVTARADTAFYRAHKYALRNWKWLSAAALFLAALLGSLAWISLLYRDVSRARSEEQAQAGAARRAAYAAKVSGAHPRIVAGEGMRALEGFTELLPDPPGWEWDRLRAKADRSLWRSGIDNSEKILDWFERPRLHCAAVASSGRFCALGCHGDQGDAYVRIVGMKTGRHVRDFPLGNITPMQVAFVGSSDLVVIGKRDGSLSLFNASTGERLRDHSPMVEGQGIHRMAINQDGVLAVTRWDAAKRRCAESVALYDARSLTQIETFDALSLHGSAAVLLDWSPDGQTLGVLRRIGRAASVEVIDVGSRSLLFRRELDSRDAEGLRWMEGAAGDAPRLAVVRPEMDCPVFDGSTGSAVAPIQSGGARGCLEIAASGSHAAYLTVGGVIELRREPTGTRTARIVVGPGQWSARIHGASGTLFAFSREGQFGVWDLSGSPDTLTEFLPLHNFTQVRSGANGTVLAVRSEGGGMLTLDAETLIPHGVLEQKTSRRAFRARAIDVHPTRPLVAVADKSGIVRTYDVPSQRWSKDLHRLGTTIRDLAYSPSGDSVVLTGSDGRVFQFASLEDPPTRVLRTPEGYASAVKCAFSRDGSRFCVNAVTKSSDTKLLEWRTYGPPDEAPRLLDSLRAPLGHYSVEETPDGRAWASGGRGCVRLIGRGGEVRSFPIEENFERYEDLTFHPDGHRAFLGGADGSVSVLDLDSLDETLTWTVAGKSVNDIEWIEPAGTLVTCSLTGELKVHRVGQATESLPADRVRHYWKEDPSPAAMRLALEADAWLEDGELHAALQIVDRLPPRSDSLWWTYAHYARLVAGGAPMCSALQLERLTDQLGVVASWRPDRTIDALPSLLFETRRFEEMLEMSRAHHGVHEANGANPVNAICFQAIAAHALGLTEELERLSAEWIAVEPQPTSRLHLIRTQALARALTRPDGRPWLSQRQ